MSTVSSLAASVGELRTMSREVRREILTMSHRAKSAHLGSGLSVVDILTVLYFHTLRVDPQHPSDPLRDRCILSKGHGCSALYAALAKRGFFPVEELATFLQDGGRLAGHPSARLLPGVDASTGSLGHGLPVGIGLALAAKLDAKDYRTFVILSDGECDEGSTWEGALAASQWKLGSLTCIIDYNKIQSFGRVDDVMTLEPFVDKWRAFNWHVQEADGHDHAQLIAAFAAAAREQEKPSVIIAHTIKGKGSSFLENTVDSHYRSPSDEQLQKSLQHIDSCFDA